MSRSTTEGRAAVTAVVPREAVGRRWRVHAAWLLVVLIAGTGMWWAGRALVRPAAVAAATPSQVATVVAKDGTVGQAVTVPGTVSFAAGPSAPAGRDGIVTSVDVTAGAPIMPGEVLATVDLRPVVAFAGVVPAFRDLAAGVRGPDVAQLRAALALPAGDRFDAATTRAVQAWQRGLGVEASGVVALGDVAFLPSLPARGMPAKGVVVGARVTIGQALVDTVVERPAVSVPADAAGGVLAPGMTATFAVAGNQLSGVLGPGVAREDGLTFYEVLGADGSKPCDAPCAAAFPAVGASQVDVSVQVTPEVTGVVVPSAAVGVQADGSRAVRTPDGTRLPVQVAAESDGMAVVDGLAAGTTVLLFGDAG